MRLVDVYELAEASHPEWFADSGKNKKKTDQESSNTILLAEDSSFFRQQMENFLSADGYTVIGCEDGLVAWNTLQETEETIELVVTDIEMPNMDGREFAKNIKGDSRFAHLPVIAVTSLASEEDMEKGYKSGIDDYQIKLDREKLLSAIARYLKKVRSKQEA